MNSLIGESQMGQIEELLLKQKSNAITWDKIIDETKELERLLVTSNTSPNNWVYGLLAQNKVETIKMFRKKGFYATAVHINNNIYSVFNNKTELKGVTEFMNHFVAVPCGWWCTIQ